MMTGLADTGVRQARYRGYRGGHGDGRPLVALKAPPDAPTAAARAPQVTTFPAYTG